MSAYALPGALFPPVGDYDGWIDNNNKEDDSLSSSSSSSPENHILHESSLQNTVSDQAKSLQTSSQNSTAAREVGIAVKEAKLDHLLLVKSLSRTSSSSRTQSGDNDKSTEHEEAIKFELSIEYNGRNYTATRTLPRIIQLRNDLIREINTRRMNLRQRRKRRRQRQQEIMLQKAALSSQEDEDTVDSEITIPEIPDCEDHSHHRGFAMLQALLRNYCPAMERWLRRVVDLVPESESLGEFLWEPIGEQGAFALLENELMEVDVEDEDESCEEELRQVEEEQS